MGPGNANGKERKTSLQGLGMRFHHVSHSGMARPMAANQDPRWGTNTLFRHPPAAPAGHPGANDKDPLWGTTGCHLKQGRSSPKRRRAVRVGTFCVSIAPLPRRGFLSLAPGWPRSGLPGVGIAQGMSPVGGLGSPPPVAPVPSGHREGNCNGRRRSRDGQNEARRRGRQG